MSLIPLDEPRGGGPSTPDEDASEATLLGQFLAGVKAAVSALPVVSALVSEPQDEGTQSAEPAALTTARPGAESVPSSLPSGHEQMAVVSTETDDTLTVEAVDNPDATIQSDTWEPIER